MSLQNTAPGCCDRKTCRTPWEVQWWRHCLSSPLTIFAKFGSITRDRSLTTLGRNELQNDWYMHANTGDFFETSKTHHLNSNCFPILLHWMADRVVFVQWSCRCPCRNLRTYKELTSEVNQFRGCTSVLLLRRRGVHLVRTLRPVYLKNNTAIICRASGGEWVWSSLRTNDTAVKRVSQPFAELSVGLLRVRRSPYTGNDAGWVKIRPYTAKNATDLF